MPRTTPEQVSSIVDVDFVSIPDITPHIDAAHTLVNRVCEPLDYDEDELTQIELWLSAHFYCVHDPQGQTEGVGGVSVTYEGLSGLHLNRTRYGQQAMLLDYLGGLAKLQKQAATGNPTTKKVSVTFLGTVDE